MIKNDDFFIIFYVIEIIIIIITIIISILHLHKLLVIRNDRRHCVRALFLLILLDYLYIFFSFKTWKIFEFAVNARRETRIFFFAVMVI